MPEAPASGKPPRSHSSLLFGGNISSFYRGSILFSYKFINKDTFLSEIPVLSCFPSAQHVEFEEKRACEPWCRVLLTALGQMLDLL